MIEKLAGKNAKKSQIILCTLLHSYKTIYKYGAPVELFDDSWNILDFSGKAFIILNH
jgi:hypothetical protein